MDPYTQGTPTSLFTKATSTLVSAKDSILNWFSSSPETISGGVLLGMGGDFYGPPAPPTKVSIWSSRTQTEAVKDITGQVGGGCSWWNVACKARESVSTVTAKAGDFVSSTLTKTIIILALVGIAAIFLITFVQSKATRLAQ